MPLVLKLQPGCKQTLVPKNANLYSVRLGELLVSLPGVNFSYYDLSYEGYPALVHM